ncbi:conjugal transfer protein TraD [Legionella maioricensis]|uniref:Conjugal transfer protein TraD n=1 Tax=Legionella maioricensis TaxID=2896528 RepID=A0A9X2IEE3_9GAMM|nr:conjugal transfer protein TraD [Legionella maioricensis]MCL9685748.1 conjugal transfer protein TraD [Legionella maioricensis]MCL9686450.1 conjugal transfer protein TraD [Legionella maioricensis]
MALLEDIEKEKQMITRCEKLLALDKLKKRRADTRQKIELGGLVIKSGINIYEKSIILGGLIYISTLIKKDTDFVSSLEILGDNTFITSKDCKNRL